LTSNSFRSGLEKSIATQLNNAGISFKYEAVRLPYIVEHKYIPDFILPNGIYIEGKGYFTSADRTKMLAVKLHHPELDIRFIFSNSSNKLRKGSKTTYGQWCDKYGFPYADKHIPKSWLLNS